MTGSLGGIGKWPPISTSIIPVGHKYISFYRVNKLTIKSSRRLYALSI